jgi:hypothetical protein
VPHDWIGALNSAPTLRTFSEERTEGSAIRRRFRDDPEFVTFVRAVLQWQTDIVACAQFQRDTDAIRRGAHGPPGARALLGAIAAAGPVAPALFRGIALPPGHWQVLANYTPGECLDFPLISFSSDYRRALEFAWLMREHEGGTEVVFHLAPGSNAVRIDLLSPDEIHWREREWISGGRFRVVSAEYNADADHVEVHLVHEGYFDAGEADRDG